MDRYGPASGDVVVESDDEVELTLDASNYNSYQIEAGVYTVYVLTEEGIFVLEKTGDVEIKDYPIVYIKGGMNEWNGTEMEYVRLNEYNQHIYHISYSELAQGTEFKFSDRMGAGSWADNFNYGLQTDNHEFSPRAAQGLHTSGDSKNIVVPADLKNVHIFFIYDPKDNEADKSSFVMIDATPTNLVIDGESIGGWNNFTANKMEMMQNAITLDNYEYDYKLHFDSFEAGQFLVRTDGDDTFKYGFGGERYGVFHKAPAVRNAGGNFDPELEGYDTGRKLTYKNVDVVFHYNPIGECFIRIIPQEMYVVNYAADELNTLVYNPEGQTASEPLMTLGRQGDLSINGPYVYAAGIQNELTGDFRVENDAKTFSFGSADENNVFGTTGTATNLTGEDAVKNASANDSAHFRIADEMYIQGSNMKLTYDPDTEAATLDVDGATTGVESIVADGEANGEAVYYNLQGVRVANPENGVFIRVEGRNASKVLVK